MAASILIVDDEPDLLDLLEMNLDKEGYSIRKAVSGAEALASIRSGRPDLVLLDVMLPDTSGIKLLSRLKNDAETGDIPIILLTAKDSETDMVVGLRVGADDYITKPFSIDVLLARIEAILRRSSAGSDDDILLFGPIKISPAKYQVCVNDKPIELTLAEFRILYALVQADGKVLSREALAAEFGTYQGEFNERVIDVHIASLRKKLGDAKNTVKTVRGLGYQFTV